MCAAPADPEPGALPEAEEVVRLAARSQARAEHRGAAVTASRVLGLVPARGGSKGMPGKNVKPLAGRPLLEYVAAAARESGVLDRVILSTESRGDRGARPRCWNRGAVHAARARWRRTRRRCCPSSSMRSARLRTRAGQPTSWSCCSPHRRSAGQRTSARPYELLRELRRRLGGHRGARTAAPFTRLRHAD